ncbi:methyltransferase type 11 [Candidatus Vecturithrix granuli]|uniref:Methyltransferase type 11 n=1 Tax=Vecturithrix granuli TaxID=1499967 RepID=A0A081C1Y1_VECG1|nr:methyltransferase type 11 [Candidatus Vecturithrix granuli]
MTNDKIYWDKIADQYDRHVQRSATMYEHMLQLITQELTPEMIMLDIGTGTGEIPLRICQDVRRIEAIDSSEAMIRQAQAKVTKQQVTNVMFHVHDSSSLPYEDHLFDLVLIANVLHILPDPRRVLTEAYRVLKDEGKLLAPTYVHGESFTTRLISWVLKHRGHPIYTRFDSTTLKRFIEEAHFTVSHQMVLKNIMPVSFVLARKRRKSSDEDSMSDL